MEVRLCWRPICGVLYKTQVKIALTAWSKNVFGNIFQKRVLLEGEVKLKEIQLDISPSVENREELHRATAELKRYWYLEEEFWKQKAGMT